MKCHYIIAGCRHLANRWFVNDVESGRNGCRDVHEAASLYPLGKPEKRADRLCHPYQDHQADQYDDQEIAEWKIRCRHSGDEQDAFTRVLITAG
jgi:hypothetical protein